MMKFEYCGYVPALNDAQDGGMPARVVSVQRERYGLLCPQGETFGRLRKSAYFSGEELFPTVGDYVLIDGMSVSDSQILRTLPRRTFFERRDPTPGRGGQAVAANFDQVFIVQSLNQDFNEKRLERYLALALASGAEPVVVLTKADLMPDREKALGAARRLAAGAAVYAVSAHTGEGLDALRGYMQSGKTSVFLGSSGVGKSSLVNALAGEEIMAVSAIREEDGKGRHTTTHRQLIMLANGAMVIDTPGMRELGMWAASEGVSGAFADVEQYLGRCRFGDCRHEREPGCAVRAAIESGELPRERWLSYQKLRRESDFSEDRARSLREKTSRFKQIAKKSREMKKR